MAPEAKHDAGWQCMLANSRKQATPCVMLHAAWSTAASMNTASTTLHLRLRTAVLCPLCKMRMGPKHAKRGPPKPMSPCTLISASPYCCAEPMPNSPPALYSNCSGGPGGMAGKLRAVHSRVLLREFGS